MVVGDLVLAISAEANSRVDFDDIFIDVDPREEHFESVEDLAGDLYV